MQDIVSKILISLIVAGVSWLVYTTVEMKGDIKVIKYQLNTNNIVLQDIYETKKDK